MKTFLKVFAAIWLVSAAVALMTGGFQFGRESQTLVEPERPDNQVLSATGLLIGNTDTAPEPAVDFVKKLAEAQRRVADLEQREAERQATLVAAAPPKTAQQIRQDAEAQALIQRENEIARKLAAVSGPGFEETVSWLNKGFREKWPILCTDVSESELRCTTVSVEFDSSCSGIITETNMHSKYHVGEYSKVIKIETWRNTYNIENIGFVDSRIEWINSDDRQYPKELWRITNQGRRQTLQGADVLEYKRGNQRFYVKSRPGGSIRRSTSHTIDTWDKPGDMSGHEFESRSETDVSEYNASVDVQLPGQMGPKVLSALDQYVQFCRIKFPDAPELF